MPDFQAILPVQTTIPRHSPSTPQAAQVLQAVRKKDFFQSFCQGNVDSKNFQT
jgi:hypothetical protein